MKKLKKGLSVLLCIPIVIFEFFRDLFWPKKEPSYEDGWDEDDDGPFAY